ncbi:radical SAM family heme chaperone HemW [Tibeticola sp.]|uniref:radical SAM family heme chaperone HemW n=1 Tax=Tibeticola sp. TaxID=2005368 RepID=UPI0025849BE4|nr:radical SAM family heme chaperone HemW [Tibeticola sp.]
MAVTEPLSDVAAHYLRPGTLQLREQPPLSLYVHLPWCLKKCPYCDFNSHAVRAAPLAEHTLVRAAPQGRLPSAPEVNAAAAVPEARYVEALVADLDASLPLVWGRPIVSVFIGGGTPSLFSPEAIERLLSAIRARLPLIPDCEVTLEANPGTFERDRFAAYRAAGVTRLSIGVQSFNDAALQALGRVHDRAQAIAAVEEAARAFDTFNLDLMYALPQQTLAALDEDLATALAFAPPHLSVYHLTIEPNTYFAKHPPALPEDDLAYAMLDRITERTAAAGLERYEVSAYARRGHRCVHNQNYWQFGDYLGIGAGAHGKLSFPHRIVRQVRWREPERYLERALAGAPIAQAEEVARADLPFEFMLNALRLREGFDLARYTARTGLPLSTLEPKLAEAERRGWIERDLQGLRPTERGFDFLSDLQALFLP